MLDRRERVRTGAALATLKKGRIIPFQHPVRASLINSLVPLVRGDYCDQSGADVLSARFSLRIPYGGTGERSMEPNHRI